MTQSEVKVKGWWDIEVYNPDGSLHWKGRADNGATTGGLNDMLNVYFGAGTQKTTWYIGLISNAGFSSLAAGDTMGTHSGWAEATAYTEGVRQTWGLGAASGGSASNSVTANFTINATVTVYGLFLASDSTKGGTAGTLYSTGQLVGGPQTLTSGQVVKATYTVAQTATN